ncbi:ABC transporter ATP-binding protein [Kribbella sp. NPDC058245]|uniref:ABC transporter ATP-binding protein n=1 Tax=Kribbella sp. NPDC058245 TaxID=3346399 RepID=UPI0036DFAA99
MMEQLEKDAVGTSSPPPGRLLQVKDLQVEFRLRTGVVKAVAGLSYSLDKGETLAIVGESGSGKSVAAHAVLGVLTTPPAFVTGGSVHLQGRNLLTMSETERRRLRGDELAMVAQNASLNPVFSVGWQIAELFRVHRGTPRREAMKLAAGLMDRVGIPSAAQRVDDYPHQFSGGMRQRVGIAMAMALEPAVLIADEPTTALDVTVQAQIMALLAEMQEQTGMGLILITHDLGLVSEAADRLVVMYAGRECETGSVEEVFRKPGHPYTRGLMKSIPQLDQKKARLEPIAGSMADLMSVPPGCPFHPRCPFAQARCRTDALELHQIAPGRVSSCHRIDEIWGDLND